MFAGVAVSLLGQAHATTAFALPSTSDFRNNDWSFGQIFTVGPQNITVTALGAYDAGGDGFTTPGGIPVGIFQESNGALLASTFVLSSDPLSADFRYDSIAPLTLLSGVSYRVVADNESDLYNLGSSLTVDPAITSTGFGYCNTATLTSCNDFGGSGDIWMANFQFGTGGVDPAPTPEPVSFVLSAAGLLGLALVRTRRRA
jgi:hypothetical protein